MMFNATIHTIVGIVIYPEVIPRMVAGGLVNTVHDSVENEAAWWFFVVGLAYLSAGLLLRWMRTRAIAPPSRT